MFETVKIPVGHYGDDVSDIHMRANAIHEKLAEITLWLEENIHGYYNASCGREDDVVYGIYRFLDKEDAFFFRMRWQ